MRAQPLLSVSGLTKHFPLGNKLFAGPTALVRAVEGVSFSIKRGETFGLVGESGCGKSTLGRMIIRLIHPTKGKIVFAGEDITNMNRVEMRPFREKMQIIFQDPYSSLDPRMRVSSIVTEPLYNNKNFTGKERTAIAAGLLESVGLKSDDLKKYPHEFSGGQRQRIGIARALCVRPQFIVADEPVSALDVSIQAQVINLLTDLKAQYDLSYLFISHDMSVVQHTCDRIAVMYLGAIIEIAPADGFSAARRHPYSRALLEAVPKANPHHRKKFFAMDGDVPSPLAPPRGCCFHPRCPHAFDRCQIEKPMLKQISQEHRVACWLNNGQGVVIP
jgi:oligopeptide/dipeptide ABC transporter ATP-binding protein